MTRRRRASRTVFLLVILVALAGCRRSPAADTQPLSMTATVARGPMADVVQVSGQVIAPRSQMVAIGGYGGRVLSAEVRPGQMVQEGQVLLRLDTAGQERELREAQADLKAAEAVLQEAQATAGPAETAMAEADLAKAEYELAAAKAAVAESRQVGLAPLEEAVADAEVALQLAEDRLRQEEYCDANHQVRTKEYHLAFFQRTLRDLRRGEDPTKLRETVSEIERDLGRARAARDEALQAARDEVTKAREKLAKDEAALGRARAGQDDPTAPARLAYEEASLAVDKARKALAELKTGADSATMKAAKTAYEAAVARVGQAEAAIAEATLRAPFASVVFALFVEPGQEVQPNADALFLADPDELRVQAQATEMDIPRLAVGQAVRISLDACPGKLFEGQVLSLPVKGQDSGGMSFFAIETSLKQEGADIRPGMTANVRVVIGEKQDVLLVPLAAVQFRPPDYIYVTVRGEDGRPREQKVQVGNDDGIMIEVQDGLREGQTVIIPLAPPMDPRQWGPMRMPMGY